MTSEQTLTRAANMGRRAGELYRETAVPQPCPFDERHTEARDTWTRAYVAAAYT